MKTWLSFFVRLSPRFYELFSVLLTSAGINLLTGAPFDTYGVPLAGVSLVFAGVLCWLSSWRVGNYREFAGAQQQELKEHVLSQTGNPSEPVVIPSVQDLALKEAANQPTVKLLSEFSMVLASIILVFGSIFFLNQKERSAEKRKKLDVEAVHTENPIVVGRPASKSDAPTIIMRTVCIQERHEPEESMFANVYSKSNNEVGNLPAILFVHGGGMVVGDRQLDLSPGSLATRLIADGYTVISCDYRLAPKHRLQDAITDVLLAAEWTRKNAGTIFPGVPKRIVVMGESAGAYLSLLTGNAMTPKADAVVALWGYGDLTGDWYRKPSEYWSTFPIVSKEAAEKNGGVDLYIHSRQNGTWVESVTGLSFDKNAEEIRSLCPLFNVTRDFPNTFLLAGTADKDVPYEESRKMSDAISRNRGSCELVTIPGGGHGWEETPDLAKESAIGQILLFLQRVDRESARGTR
jgi:acetyl esterase/lipase